MSTNLQSILKNKAHNKTLASLYILEATYSNENHQCLEWIKDLLAQITNINTSKLENAQDILILDANDKKNYQQEHIQQIYQFLSFQALELGQKFLIIPECEKISTNHYNKLLKTFEEPPVALTAFLINDHKVKILPTIESRAIQLKIPTQKAQLDPQWKEFLIKSHSLIEFLDFVEKNDLTPHKLCTLTLDIIQQHSSHYQHYAQTIKAIKSIQEDIKFNNSASQINVKIYHILSKLRV
ncbi:MAG: hypothetical protein QF441_05295 [Bacteriovoracaceae bacterium]|jgi:DNA polymerase III delta prime subunit|nr:hypothetical protein [Halobacteriovoraceae bacterium]MDP7320000.1 hypothetical protein [Bacteriovoracaceae bacterium]